MNWEIISKVALGLVTTLAGLIQLTRGRSYPREHLRHDIEILERLPEDSEARAKLLAHVEHTIIKTIKLQDDRRRDPLGTTLGAIFIIGGLALAYYGWHTETFWRWILWTGAVLLLPIGIAGFVQDVAKRERDDKGRPLNSK